MYVRKSDGVRATYRHHADEIYFVQFGDEPARLMCWSEFIGMVTLVNG